MKVLLPYIFYFGVFMQLLFSIKRAIRSLQMCLIFSFWFGCGLYGRVYDYKTPTARYLRDIEISELDSGMVGIDCIYVINLDDRPRKWGGRKRYFKWIGFASQSSLSLEWLGAHDG